MMKKSCILSGLIVLALFLSSCTTFGFLIEGTGEPGSGSRSSGGQVKAIPAFGNNETVNLDAGRYDARVIDRNKVVLVGQGTGATTVVGNLRITGNSAEVRNLTIQGDAILEGNNITLTGVRVTGVVRSTGNNNSW